MQVRIKRKKMHQEWEVGYAVGHTRCWPGWSQVYATDRDRDEQIDRQTDGQTEGAILPSTRTNVLGRRLTLEST